MKTLIWFLVVTGRFCFLVYWLNKAADAAYSLQEADSMKAIFSGLLMAFYFVMSHKAMDDIERKPASRKSVSAATSTAAFGGDCGSAHVPLDKDGRERLWSEKSREWHGA